MKDLVKENVKTSMKIASEAFHHNGKIPSKYTCEGVDVSPGLIFTGIPAKAKSLAIIVEDPDAPGGTFVHWVAWGLSPNTQVLAENDHVPHQGTNDFGVKRYRGPCPPPGKVHRYFFKVYALDTTLGIPDGSTKEQLEAAMQGHILGQAELIGLYSR